MTIESTVLEVLREVLPKAIEKVLEEKLPALIRKELDRQLPQRFSPINTKVKRLQRASRP